MKRRKKRKVAKRSGRSRQNLLNRLIVTHSDEQLEGALMECLQKLKTYCVEGAIIVLTDDNKWKVLSFCSEKERNFEMVLGDSLRAGVEALETGGDSTSSWQLD